MTEPGVKFQINFKTKAGSLINGYAGDAAELAHGLLVLGENVAQILATEQQFLLAGEVSSVIPLAAVQPAPPALVPPQPVQPPAPTYMQQPAPATNWQQPPSQWSQPAPAPQFAQNPMQVPGEAVTCKCGQPAKMVPGGVSKKTNKPYKAFYTCPTGRDRGGCDFSQTA